MPATATLLVTATLVGELATPFTCTFTEACIDGRRCFDSHLRARVVDRPGAPQLAVLTVEGSRPLLAAVSRNGVWTTFRTRPDDLQNDRVLVLDVAESGDATLVEAERGTAIDMLSRRGTCVQAPESGQ